jgi:DNA-binding HxlR family transcriptional regulator
LMHRPLRSKLHQLPDVGHLLLVLYKLGVLSQRIRVLDLSRQPTPASQSGSGNISEALQTLEEHGVIELVQVDSHERVKDRTSREELTPAENNRLLVVLDLDNWQRPPKALNKLIDPFDQSFDTFDDQQASAVASRQAEFVAWSVDKGFDKLDDEPVWKEFMKHTLVARPKAASQMLEAVLCRILKISLGGESEECSLTAGGPFKVHADDLQFTESRGQPTILSAAAEASSTVFKTMKSVGKNLRERMAPGTSQRRHNQQASSPASASREHRSPSVSSSTTILCV